MGESEKPLNGLKPSRDETEHINGPVQLQPPKRSIHRWQKSVEHDSSRGGGGGSVATLNCVSKSVDSAMKSKGIINTRKTAGKGEIEEFEFCSLFMEDKVRSVVHIITKHLKTNKINDEYLFLPFRNGQSNQKLLQMLKSVFPQGNSEPVSNESLLKIIAKTDGWTLVQMLKYIWCRLPQREIVGWKAYMSFKKEEERQGYPEQAFLDIMPRYLNSPDHASIVYDFFDLIVAVASNAHVNKMSLRKLTRMCAIWAFEKGNDGEEIAKDTFRQGIQEWIKGSDAMFHLALSFIRSFVPHDLESSSIPKILKNVLVSEDYPPLSAIASSPDCVLTVPVVTLRTDTFSSNPWRLIERCNDLFEHTKPNDFDAREDYVLMKTLFKRRDNIDEINKKMSKESRRLLKEMMTKHSTFQAGWVKKKSGSNPTSIPEYLEWSRIDIDDYFIWAWMSSLSHEETAEKKMSFGRSLMVEFEIDGFKKWAVIEEADVSTGYKHKQSFIWQNGHRTERQMTPTYEEYQERGITAVPPKPVEKRSPLSIDPDAVTEDRNGIQLHAESKSPLEEPNQREKEGSFLGEPSDRAFLDIVKKEKFAPPSQLRMLSNHSLGEPGSVRQSSSTYDEQSIREGLITPMLAPVKELPTLQSGDEKLGHSLDWLSIDRDDNIQTNGNSIQETRMNEDADATLEELNNSVSEMKIALRYSGSDLNSITTPLNVTVSQDPTLVGERNVNGPGVNNSNDQSLSTITSTSPDVNGKSNGIPASILVANNLRDSPSSQPSVTLNPCLKYPIMENPYVDTAPLESPSPAIVSAEDTILANSGKQNTHPVVIHGQSPNAPNPAKEGSNDANHSNSSSASRIQQLAAELNNESGSSRSASPQHTAQSELQERQSREDSLQFYTGTPRAFLSQSRLDQKSTIDEEPHVEKQGDISKEMQSKDNPTSPDSNPNPYMHIRERPQSAYLRYGENPIERPQAYRSTSQQSSYSDVADSYQNGYARPQSDPTNSEDAQSPQQQGRRAGGQHVKYERPQSVQPYYNGQHESGPQLDRPQSEPGNVLSMQVHPIEHSPYQSPPFGRRSQQFPPQPFGGNMQPQGHLQPQQYPQKYLAPHRQGVRYISPVQHLQSAGPQAQYYQGYHPQVAAMPPQPPGHPQSYPAPGPYSTPQPYGNQPLPNGAMRYASPPQNGAMRYPSPPQNGAMRYPSPSSYMQPTMMGTSTTPLQPAPPSPKLDLGYAPPAQPVNKLHGGGAFKQMGRKKLYKDIKSGNFGI